MLLFWTKGDWFVQLVEAKLEPYERLIRRATDYVSHCRYYRPRFL